MRYFTLVCCLIMLPLVAFGAEDSLRGLEKFDIVIEDLDQDARACGVTKSDLQREVELKLRLAGIPIDDESTTGLYVRLSVMVRNNSLCVYSLGVSVGQLAMLLGNGEIDIVVTWGERALGTVGQDLPGGWIKDSLRDMMDQFLIDYLEVNPRTR